MKSRRLFAALAVTTALVGAACSSGNNDAKGVNADGTVDLSQVTLHLGDQKGQALQALLEVSGEAKDLPYKVDWANFTAGPPMLEAINAGSVDFGGVGDAPPVFAAAAKSQIKIAAAYDSGAKGQAIVVPKDSPLQDPKDLRGKKIAVTKGSSAHYHLLSVLTRNGLTFSDIEPQYLQPADALAALSTGRVDAWTVWDPYVAQAELGGNRVLVDGTGYVKPDTFYVVGAKTLQNKAAAAAVRDLLTRIQRAPVWITGHHEDWAKRSSEITGVPYDVTLLAVNRGNVADHPLDDATITAEQQVADAFSDAKLIPGKVRIADFIDTRYNDRFTA
ncbi:ABC transporter substrate-binding protein [Nocardia seriolae]|uniref:ABC transporter substrate-binding protein n=1 Tax=Nocardia seriolae TaxID=37332 RepID=UPI0004B7B9A5|nr:ABC transporter substrate-binding protein [Nocardia seriolae]MTJ65547.1 aliphatic sulfonate ABC transporter substrate-binding protein [Nocardia seriolae]MTJ75105.1 aliphatic sulfonate ABC transporter substrate-binding protein [Nocardia seriolae]MTJ90425.1 aliphatic sulfonate ABC transporter substrate-binding protein [Nocardia seriolae]MTK34386.1 aliphatic sulfonate ABC transporter substrate-binding protein [Nocardia seriolae]MTK43536.1 aliphatic sulfonate ABC transporter substrate-binding p